MSDQPANRHFRFAIRHFRFAIRHFRFAIRHLPFALPNKQFTTAFHRQLPWAGAERSHGLLTRADSRLRVLWSFLADTLRSD